MTQENQKKKIARRNIGSAINKQGSMNPGSSLHKKYEIFLLVRFLCSLRFLCYKKIAIVVVVMD